MRIDQLSVTDAIASLHSAPQGLSADEALRRLGEFGPNQVEKMAGQALWLRLFKEFFHFFAVVLWLATGLAFLGEWFSPGQGMAKVGCVVIGVILVSGLFSFWQEYRAEHAQGYAYSWFCRREAVRRLGGRHGSAVRRRDRTRTPRAHLRRGARRIQLHLRRGAQD